MKIYLSSTNHYDGNCLIDYLEKVLEGESKLKVIHITSHSHKALNCGVCVHRMKA